MIVTFLVVLLILMLFGGGYGYRSGDKTFSLVAAGCSGWSCSSSLSCSRWATYRSDRIPSQYHGKWNLVTTCERCFS